VVFNSSLTPRTLGPALWRWVPGIDGILPFQLICEQSRTQLTEDSAGTQEAPVFALSRQVDPLKTFSLYGR
jgi:hypothetical protein